MDDLQIKQLIQKYLDGQCTAEESALLESWYLKQSTVFQRPDAEMINKNEALMSGYLQSRMAERKTVRLWPGIAIAAAVAAITLGTWLYYSSALFSGRHPEFISGSPLANGIQPGRNTATLTLASGEVINLSDKKTGVIIDVSKLSYSDGSAIRHPEFFSSDDDSNRSSRGLKPPISGPPPGKSTMHDLNSKGGDPGLHRDDGVVRSLAISTPRGGTYQVTLPDGTEVWLNADSKITFPSAFSGKQRHITLSGEAYFQVAKDKSKPFIVESKGQQVEVLGTHFNINAYADEGSTKTTLLEGSVKVSAWRGSAGVPDRARHDGSGVTLRPGQQSILNNRNQISIKTVDINEAMAWQKGYFSFYDEHITSIMRKVSRWYNIDVEYSGDLPQNGFDARINKHTSIKEVLGKLEKTGDVHFKIEGRKVIVSK